MVNNILGRGLNEGTWLSMPTIGNARQINASYGAADLLIPYDDIVIQRKLAAGAPQGVKASD